MSLATIPEALDALRAGKPVIVADDEARENEGDVDHGRRARDARSGSRGWCATSSGFICAPMTNADRRPARPAADGRAQRGRARHGLHGERRRRRPRLAPASAPPTARTPCACSPTRRRRPTSVIRPGHILPLRAVDGGVRERGGHTEAAVDLMRLAGLTPVGAIAEIVADDGEMMRLPGLIELGERDGVPVITIEQLIAYLDEHEPAATSTPTRPSPAPSRRACAFEVETTCPTAHGVFRFRAYRTASTGADHVAIVSGDPPATAPLVRVHSECLTGEAFGSLKCECGPQLDAALDAIEQDGRRRHLPARPRGSRHRAHQQAARLPPAGGRPRHARREPRARPARRRARLRARPPAILADLGIEQVRLLTNNPEKVRQLSELGLDVVEQVPLVVGVGPNNDSYLDTKRDRMGHVIADERADAMPLAQTHWKDTHHERRRAPPSSTSTARA